MASNFTTNKSIEQPLNGSYNNDWDVPMNADWGIVDTCLGGTTSIVVTGVAAGSYALSTVQYQPPNIEFSGVLSGNLVYYVPTGIGGVWSLQNSCTGSYTLSFGLANGSTVSLLSSGFRTFLISDGASVQQADSAYAYLQAQAAISAAETYATNAANTAQSNAEAFATSAANTAQSNAETYAASQASTAQSNAEDFAMSAANTAQTNAETYANGTHNFLFSSGWAKMPSGLIIQGGTVTASSTGSTVTFPEPFPIACISVVETAIGQPNGYIETITSTSFVLFNGSSTQSTWIAIGY